MELIAITVPYFYNGEGEDVAAALDSGRFARVHIRKPGGDPEGVRRLLGEIPERLRSRISLHDCHSLATEYGVGGIHLNSRNPSVPDGWEGVVSRSLHSIDEIPMAGDCDYAFLSPVYPSISKPGYSGSFDFKELKQKLRPNIYALGGVTAARLSELEELGFRGAALLGSAWSEPIDNDAFRLQFITAGRTEEEVVAGAMDAARGGCRWIQIRMKDAEIDAVERVARTLAPLRHTHRVVLLVDDHVEMAARLDFLDGVHVGKNDMPVAEARRMLGPSKILGATANRFEDLEQALENGADYVGLGPLRFTTTKKNLSPILGIGGYVSVMEECRRKGYRSPVVAIGGITAGDIPALLGSGVSGIAVSGSILRADNPVEATRTLLTTIENATNN